MAFSLDPEKTRKKYIVFIKETRIREKKQAIFSDMITEGKMCGLKDHDGLQCGPERHYCYLFEFGSGVKMSIRNFLYDWQYLEVPTGKVSVKVNFVGVCPPRVVGVTSADALG